MILLESYNIDMTNSKVKAEAKKFYDAMDFVRAIKSIGKSTKSLFLSRCYDQLALVTKNVATRKKYQFKALKICQGLLLNHPKSAGTLNQLGNIYHHMALDEPKCNKQALSYFKQALSLAKTHTEKIECLNNIANSYQRIGNLEKALKYYLQGNDLAKGKDIAILYNLSFTYLKLKMWDKCLEVSNKYMKLSKKFSDSKMRTMFRNSIQNNISMASDQ